MIDRQTICQRLHALEGYTAELERFAVTLSRERFDAELGIQWMVEHGLHLAVECILDIGNHLVAAEELGKPQTYREVIDLLGQHGVLPAEFALRIRRMPAFRNILVHDYLAVDTAMVWDMLQDGPEQFREFMRHVAAHLRPRPAS